MGRVPSSLHIISHLIPTATRGISTELSSKGNQWSPLPGCWLRPFSKLCGSRYRVPRCPGNSRFLWPSKLPSPPLPLQPYHFTSFQFIPVPSIPASPVSFLAIPPVSITFYLPSSLHHAPSKSTPDWPTCIHSTHFIEGCFVLKPVVLSPRKTRLRERKAGPVPTILDSAGMVCLGFHLVPVIQARNNPPGTSFQVHVLSVHPFDTYQVQLVELIILFRDCLLRVITVTRVLLPPECLLYARHSFYSHRL